jgi:hypothetical protein
VVLKKESFDIHYNEQHATFTDSNSAPEMVLQQQGPDGIRLATNDGMHLYGQYQVTAKIAGASGVVTAFYVSGMLAAGLVALYSRNTGTVDTIPAQSRVMMDAHRYFNQLPAVAKLRAAVPLWHCGTVMTAAADTCLQPTFLLLQVRSTDTYTLGNKDSPFHEIDIGEQECNLQQAFAEQ